MGLHFLGLGDVEKDVEADLVDVRATMEKLNAVLDVVLRIVTKLDAALATPAAAAPAPAPAATS